ncbi:hypothetical protein Hanom_Chr17g01573391 [Helianthus anomalus]
MKFELDLGSIRAYLFELELGSQVKPKAQARLDLARSILRRTSNELKAQLELASLSFNCANARLEFGSPML